MSSPGTSGVTRLSQGQKQEANGSGTLHSLQRNMEEELERKRREWEEEVRKMQDEFFGLRTVGGGGDSVDIGRGGGSGRSGVRERKVRVQSVDEPGPTEGESSDPTIYRVTFDMKGYSADNIEVKVESDKVAVSATREEKRGNTTTIKQFNRHVDLPHAADRELVEARLSPDGTLTIEAPLDPSRPANLGQGHSQLPYEYYDSADDHVFSQQNDEAHYGSRDGHRVGAKTSSSGSLSSAASPHSPRGSNVVVGRAMVSPPSYSSVSTEGGSSTRGVRGSSSSLLSPSSGSVTFSVTDTPYGRKWLMIVDVGDFSASDIEVTLQPAAGTVLVQAKREKTSTSGSHMIRSEFSRHFDVDADIAPQSLRAALGPNGLLYVGASCLSNDDHDTMRDALLLDIPSPAQLVKVSVARR